MRKRYKTKNSYRVRLCYLCPEKIAVGEFYYLSPANDTKVCFTCHLELDLEERERAPKGSKANYKTIAGEATKSITVC